MDWRGGAAPGVVGFRVQGLWLGSLAGFVGNGFSIQGRWPSTLCHVLISRALAGFLCRRLLNRMLLRMCYRAEALPSQVKWSCACLRVLKSMAPGPREFGLSLRTVAETLLGSYPVAAMLKELLV